MKNFSTLLIFLSVTFCNTLFAQPTTNGLVGYFPMDESSDTILINHADGKKIMPNGTIHNPQWSDDIAKFGSCLYFDLAENMPDEIPSYVDFGTYDPTQGKNALTVTCWLYWNGINGEYAGITGKRDDWTNETVHWDLTLKREGWYQFESMAKGDVKNFLLSPDLPVIKDWEHFALTYNGIDARMYVNGKLVSEGKMELGLKTDAIFLLGCVEPLGVTPFNGFLDEVRYYNRELSPSEILKIYQYEPATSGMNEISSGNAEIFPNPMVDKLTINMKDLKMVKLYDVMGNLLLNQVVSKNYTIIDASNLRPGIYFVKAFGKENITKKIMKY
jgi:hypothetical protein